MEGSPFKISLSFCLMVFHIIMVVTRHGAEGLRSGFGSGYTTKPIDKRLHGLIAAEVTTDILDTTPMIFWDCQGGDDGDHGGAAQVFPSRG